MIKDIQARPVFKRLIDGINEYGESMIRTAQKFREDYTKAAKWASDYKDEKRLLAEKRTQLADKARQEVAQHGHKLGEVAASCVKELSNCVEDHLCRPVPAATEKALNLYSRYNLPLSKSELDALLTVNGGHVLGLRLINKMLEETGSQWAVEYTPLERYEEDLRDLQRLAVMTEYEPAFPVEYLPEAALIFCGQSETEVVKAPGLQIGKEVDYNPAGDMLRTNTLNKAAPAYHYNAETGTAADIGNQMDAVQLNAISSSFGDLCKRIIGDEKGEVVGMASYWAADIGRTAADISYHDDVTPAPVSGTKIIPAKHQTTKETAQGNAPTAAETMKQAGMK